MDRPYSLVHLLLKSRLLKSHKFSDDSLLEGLITYLIDYRTAPDKKEFRRNTLISGGEKSRAFFYYFKIADAIGESQFISALKNYLEQEFLEETDSFTFLDYLQREYFTELQFLPPFENFKKVRLKGKAQIYKYHEDTYLLYFFLVQSGHFRKLKVPIWIRTQNYKKEFLLTMSNRKEIFQLALNSMPEEILIDPEFKLWRELEFEEIPVNFTSLEKKPGILIYPKEKYPLYRHLINFFEDLGYQPYSQEKLLKFSQNLVYLDYSPFPWNFEKPLKGFYFKIIPNPWGGKSYIAYFYASSIKELESGLKKLMFNKNAAEFKSLNDKVLYKKTWKPRNGIKICSNSDLASIKIENTLTTEELVRKVLDARVILLNKPEYLNKKVLKFFENFIKLFYKYDSSLAIAMDLPKNLKSCIITEEEQEAMENEILCREEELTSDEVVLLNFLRNLIKDNKKLKIIFMGLPAGLKEEVLEKGLEGIEEKYKDQLPEMDLLNPPYQTVLKEYYHFYSEKKTEISDFEKFYQLEVLKSERFAESIYQFLKEFQNYQVIAIVPKLQLISPWGLIKSLKKRKISHVKTIFVQTHEFVDIEGINYLIQIK
jgi:hypothetical protein